MNEQNDKGWIENPDNISKLYRILLVVCALLLVADLLDLMHVFYHKHTHYDVEGWFPIVFSYLQDLLELRRRTVISIKFKVIKDSVFSPLPM